MVPPPPAAAAISIHHPLLALLSTSKTLPQIQQSHALLITSGLASHPFTASKLISHLLLLLPSALSYADLVFRHTPSHTIFTYNTLIKAHNQSSSLLLFRSLLRLPLQPNRYTFTSLLPSLAPPQALQVRAQALRRGHETSVYVCNVLVQMYGGWGRVEDARKVFDGCPHRDLFSWNLLMGGYVGCGDLGQAREVFDQMPERDVVSWSTVIAGYVQVGSFLEAMELFRGMLLDGAPPNEFTLTTILAACANLVALDQGKWIHKYINKSKFKMNERLLAGLIDMYAKCGELESALKLFNGENNMKNTVRPWNAMLSGFAIHGRSEEAIKLFERMQAVHIAPDKVTFVSLLNACSHGRLVDLGRLYFNSMRTVYGLDPGIEHYGCMVDLLGRAGRLKEAQEIVSTMPMPPDTAIWGALLGSCRIHKDIETATQIGKFISDLDPKHVGCQILLANIYSVSGRWNDAKEVRKGIQVTGVKKTPGCSSIELNGMFHQFLVGDRSHPQTKQIYSFLDDMANKLKIAGYSPEIGEVLLDIDEEDRETALSRHSEKLAIAFGLINTPPRTPIRIVKNLRVCWDCHHATKFISKVYDREIIVRDRIRFHHFKDGFCSCKDYW